MAALEEPDDGMELEGVYCDRCCVEAVRRRSSECGEGGERGSLDDGDAEGCPGWRVICREPLMAEVDLFSAEECVALIDATVRVHGRRRESGTHGHSGHENTELRAETMRRHGEDGAAAAIDKLHDFVGRFLDCPAHGSELHPRIGFTPPAPRSASVGRSLPLGLHVDTNRRPRRFCTAITYLVTLDDASDGCTVFPCARGTARSAGAKESGAALLRRGVEHTMACPPQDLHVRRMHRAMNDGTELRPRRGKTVLFFGRDHRGRVDPASFHGGAAVRGRARVAASSRALRAFFEAA